MALIKDGQKAKDPWQRWLDGDEIEDSTPLLVGYDDWQRERDALSARHGALGVSLPADRAPEDLAADLDRLSLIELPFESFSDGRPFTQARQLREQFRFPGEIRASGRFLRDQAFFLLRCGVDTFEVADDAPIEPWLTVQSTFSVRYQPAADNAAGGELEQRARSLDDAHGDADASALLRAAIHEHFPGRIAVVSSFGSESAVLLDLVASVDPSTPVIFLDSLKHFPETLVYREALIDRLGLTDVRVVTPDAGRIQQEDPDGTLWSQAPDRCCALRKVAPLASALRGFDAWISGLKRAHGGSRAGLRRVEVDRGRIKVNPLADWTSADIAAAFVERNLPRHPLVARGYRSIGCAPCTAPVTERGSARSGRWAGQAKTECGIHRAAWARA